MIKTDRILEIGIEKMTAVSEMAKLIKMAETKEDVLYILQKMQDELEEGLAELER